MADGGRIRLYLLIAAACLSVGVGAVYLLGRSDDPSATPDTATASTELDQRDGTEAADEAAAAPNADDARDDRGPVSTSTDRASTTTAAVSTEVRLGGLPAGAQLREGDVVRVSAEGVDAGVAVALVVDSTVVDTATAGEGLTWAAAPGSHLLSVVVVDTDVASDPVPVEVSTVTVEQLRPVGAVATNERSPVPRLRCGGSNSFEAELLIDGDPNTGWGASAGDGQGQSVTVDFGQQVTITRVGLSPGYLRVAPRASRDCRSTLAFDHNRFVERIEYRFDDGSSVVQDFVREASIQEMSIAPVATRRVTILIASTVRQIEDDDTIVSEAVFFGFPP